MAGPILYSTNPWFAHEIATKHLQGRHVVWCSEYFDPANALTGSPATAIAPSSSPKSIFDALRGDCIREDKHSALIKNYKKTFRRLARAWEDDGTITEDERDEIIAAVNATSWRIWRPVLYVIPREPIVRDGRLDTVPHAQRAAYGPELQIRDLHTDEFDIIESPLWQ